MPQRCPPPTAWCPGRSRGTGTSRPERDRWSDACDPGRVRYDNLKPAVVRVLKGRDRTESERFTALRSHYGFDSFFCRPGIEGAHEKGGVEGEIGRFRRRHLVPVPNVASLAELTTLLPLPDEPFDPARLLQARVDNRARVPVRQCYYSVPARLTGRRLPVRLSAMTVEILDAGT